MHCLAAYSVPRRRTARNVKVDTILMDLFALLAHKQAARYAILQSPLIASPAATDIIKLDPPVLLAVKLVASTAILLLALSANLAIIYLLATAYSVLSVLQDAVNAVLLESAANVSRYSTSLELRV